MLIEPKCRFDGRARSTPYREARCGLQLFQLADDAGLSVVRHSGGE